jgi:hypothetical protein
MINFGFASFPDEFDEIGKYAEKEYAEHGVFFLQDDYIKPVNGRTSAFPNTEDALIESARQISANENAAKYALFVYLAMKDRELTGKYLPCFTFPEGDFPFLAALVFLPYIDEIFSALTNKGLPEEVVRSTVLQFEDCIYLNGERAGWLGLGKRYFDHLQRYVDYRILNIGRLRFEIYKNKDAYLLENKKTGEQLVFLADGEMNADGLYSDTPPLGEPCFTAFFREGDGFFEGTPINADGKCQNIAVRLSKDEYFIRLAPGDDCLGVHIPQKGALTRETCEASYKTAIEIYKKHYPELDVKAFRCHSWMMSPQLIDILKPDSNLLEFQRPYLKYPCHTKGLDVFTFVFKASPESYSDLPEDTSLQRALKQIYLGGGYLYEFNGIFTV